MPQPRRALEKTLQEVDVVEVEVELLVAFALWACGGVVDCIGMAALPAGGSGPPRS